MNSKKTFRKSVTLSPTAFDNFNNKNTQNDPKKPTENKLSKG